MRRDRKEPEEEGSGYSWMDTYGDLVTLLLCFFVLLYSFSTIDAAKWQELVGAFTGSTVTTLERLDETQIRENEIKVEGIVDNGENDAENDSEDTDMNNAIENPYDEMFDELYKAIQFYIYSNNLETKISASKDGDIILVRFTEVVLFNSGEAVILSDGKLVLGHVINIIGENVEAIQMVRIEGHTDNVPIHTSEFNSNWELSMGRANAALKVFIDSGAVDLDKLSAVAYGEYQPVDTNDTAEGRTANRRVDFVIEEYQIDS